MSFFGQLVIGAPGAGKSTYCAGLHQIITQLKRPIICINLDPANDLLPFNAQIDIRELIRVEDVMEKLGLGPNGALLYCMKTLAKNIEWIKFKLSQFEKGYLVIDMPGQLELYNTDDSIQKIIEQFRKWDWRLCAIHLTDSLYVSDPGKFISVVLCSLCVMVNLEVAQLNVLSKVDLMPHDAPYNQEFFENLPDLKHIARLLDVSFLMINLFFKDNPVLSKYKKMNNDLCEVIESYNLVNFILLDVQDKKRMYHLIKMADNANGFSIMNAEDLRNIVLK